MGAAQVGSWVPTSEALSLEVTFRLSLTVRKTLIPYRIWVLQSSLKGKLLVKSKLTLTPSPNCNVKMRHLSAGPSEPGFLPRLGEITTSLVGLQMQSVALCVGAVLYEQFAQKYAQEGEMLTCATDLGMKDSGKLRFTPCSHTCSGHRLTEENRERTQRPCILRFLPLSLLA